MAHKINREDVFNLLHASALTLDQDISETEEMVSSIGPTAGAHAYGGALMWVVELGSEVLALRGAVSQIDQITSVVEEAIVDLKKIDNVDPKYVARLDMISGLIREVLDKVEDFDRVLGEFKS